MADKLHTAELTASFLKRLESIETFLMEADAASTYANLLIELRSEVIPNLRRFPLIGRRYLDHPPQSAEALAQLAALPSGEASKLREYLSGDYLILYTVAEPETVVTVTLLSIRRHRQISFDFAKLWSGNV